ncbi:hypothetical protein [Paenibacillus sp. FSL H7-0331]|uniref:hypothetical protein n=1 Tax=Paenibacillus sp. FSL H7-0331 TaxID=1920421 RepID=UPI00096CEB44|nr:hypothetical protein [Paenibacillus sp. FSL H7-0331]OME92529.1 hypothetical protein BK127_41980 [Paenibacillus sp. FSL H7-0331]
MDISGVTTDIASLAVIVASYVGIAKTIGLNAKYSPLLAIVWSTIFVLVPNDIQLKMVVISMIADPAPNR